MSNFKTFVFESVDEGYAFEDSEARILHVSPAGFSWELVANPDKNVYVSRQDALSALKLYIDAAAEPENV